MNLAGPLKEVKTGTKSGTADRWERFWFTPRWRGALLWQRVLIGLLSLFFFVSYLNSYADWFAADGILSTNQLGQLVEVAEVGVVARWHWSPLYWLDSPKLLTGVVGCGALLAGLTLLGIGGRSVAIAHLLVWLSVANRAWVLGGIEEIPLAIGLSGLAIAGDLGGYRGGNNSPRVAYGLAQRWFQIHLAMLALTIALAQWSTATWPTGEAVAGSLQVHGFVGMDGGGPSVTWLANQKPLMRLLAWIFVWGAPAMLVLWIAWKSRRREIAYALCAHPCLVALVTGEWPYALGMGALWLAYLPNPTPAESPRTIASS
jgi:hypothetical protein